MKLPHTDEVALFQGIVNREVLIINQFYKLVYPGLFQAASRYLNDEHDAIATVNDVYLDFMEEQRAYNDLEHMRNSLYLRMYRKCLNRVKSIKSENARWLITDLSDVSETEGPIEDDIIKNEFYGLIKDKLDVLSSRDQMILEEYFFEGKSCPEIARILKVKDSVVYNAKDRAIKRLQAIFAGKNVIIILVIFFPPD